MTDYPQLHLTIDGERLSGGGRSVHSVVNPATGETLADLPLATAADLDRALEAAARGFARWRHSSVHDRSKVLNGAAAILLARKDAIGKLLTMEQGKPLAEGVSEVAAVANHFQYFAAECHRVYGRTHPRPHGARSTVTWEPVGPVAAFAPWNFPAFNIGRKLGAPIAAGCSVIVKAAEETPASALAIVDALLEAGCPPDVCQAVFGVPDEVSRQLLASPVIRKLSFTGSTVVGKHLMKLAADNMLRTTMELGGHGPVLVFDDIDLDKTLDATVAAKYRNAGQVCVSPTRFLVAEGIYQQFRDGFAERAAKVKVGNGLDAGTQMGPLANARRPEAMERLIGDAVARGAKLLTGGQRIGNQGNFYAPTVLAEVPLDAAIMNEEPFGPVAIINPMASEEDMVAEANRLPYGLAAYMWTRDGARQRRVPQLIEAGMVGINGAAIAGGDIPFGGIKWSGHGAEDGPEGLKACLVMKTISEV